MKELPSNTRVCMQIILIPAKGFTFTGGRVPPKRKGFIFGTVSMPLYDFNRRLHQGDKRLLAWPLDKNDDRFVCMGDCYRYYDDEEIDNNFNNNLDV